VMALMAARNSEEPLLETLGGHLSEGATSNLFWATDGSLFTPSLATGCLPGIMRGEVLEVAREAGIKIVEGSFGLSSLKGAEEGFLTNSVTGIIPVSAVDDFIMPAPLPGPVTTSLMEKLQARMESFRKEKP
ncbi:aminodeoxychorismate lyase, partial [bacterium]